MKKITLFAIVLFVLSTSCMNSENHQENTIESSIDNTSISTGCIDENGESIPFYYEGYSSEGAEGSLDFTNDTLISKIHFSYATSQVIVNQDYLFEKNKLVQLKIITNQLNAERTDYVNTDSLVLENQAIFDHKAFSSGLLSRLKRTVVEKNSCWNAW